MDFMVSLLEIGYDVRWATSVCYNLTLFDIYTLNIILLCNL
jgi:hypothetical protein